MARHKRMIYDPPGSRRRRRRASSWNGGENFLTRRMFIAKAGVVTVFTGLAGRLGYLQLVQGEEYKTLAADNVIRNEILPAPRGIIYDRLGRPLAENRRAWEVRITASNLPDLSTASEERRRVLDMLISALQMEDVVVIRPRAVPEGSEQSVFERIARMLNYDEKQREREFANWDALWGDRLVMVASVSLDDAARFRSALSELPGVQVMNEVDYLVGNIWAPDKPITVKKDVPQEVALKLKANAMYMPGVTVDDAGLTRHYPGGQVFSHTLGYVRMIDGVSLDDLRNRDESNQRIYDQNDTIGKEGLEQALERRLRGVKGQRSIEVDANGVVMRTVPGTEITATEGDTAYLTIDLEFQQAVGEALRKGIEKAAEAKRKVNTTRAEKGLEPWEEPNAGSAVAYDPQTGDVLAMVSYPYYDNQLFVTGISSRKWNEYTTSTEGNAFLNRAIQEVYPPGSTFKIFLAASALSQGTLQASDTHYCAGAINVPSENNLAEGLKMACWIGWQGTGHDELDLYGAIARSCDTYFYNAAVSKTELRDNGGNAFYFDWQLLEGRVLSDTRHEFNGLGIDPLADDMKNRFWFGNATDVEILSEAIGLFPDREWKQEALSEGWSVGDTLNVSIGQYEVKVTPLQLTMNAASLGVGGIVRQPHMVHSWLRPNGEVEEVEPVELSNLKIDQEHLDIVVEGMRQVIHETHGTANRSLNSDGEFVTKWPLTNPVAAEGEEEVEELIFVGKTGTAEFGEGDPEGSEQAGARDSHAWFTCFAPLEKPEIAISVVIEAGGEGSSYSVPVADEILRAWLELTGKRPRGTVLSKTQLAVPSSDGATPQASPEATPAASPTVEYSGDGT